MIGVKDNNKRMRVNIVTKNKTIMSILHIPFNGLSAKLGIQYEQKIEEKR